MRYSTAIFVEADGVGVFGKKTSTRVVAGALIRSIACINEIVSFRSIAIFFSILEGATHQALDDAPNDAKEYIYEHYNAVFDLFLRNVFPEPPEGFFDISDAALMYAQDSLIEDIEKKGMTFEEALEGYEKRAKEYLNKRREGLA